MIMEKYIYSLNDITVQMLETAINKKLEEDKIEYEYLNIIPIGTLALVYLDGYFFGTWDILQNDMVSLEVEQQWKKLI